MIIKKLTTGLHIFESYLGIHIIQQRQEAKFLASLFDVVVQRYTEAKYALSIRASGVHVIFFIV